MIGFFPFLYPGSLAKIHESEKREILVVALRYCHVISGFLYVSITVEFFYYSTRFFYTQDSLVKGQVSERRGILVVNSPPLRRTQSRGGIPFILCTSSI